MTNKSKDGFLASLPTEANRYDHPSDSSRHKLTISLVSVPAALVQHLTSIQKARKKLCHIINLCAAVLKEPSPLVFSLSALSQLSRLRLLKLSRGLFEAAFFIPDSIAIK